MDFINSVENIGKKKVKIPQDILDDAASIIEQAERNNKQGGDMFSFLDLIKGPKIMIYTGVGYGGK